MMRNSDSMSSFTRVAMGQGWLDEFVWVREGAVMIASVLGGGGGLEAGVYEVGCRGTSSEMQKVSKIVGMVKIDAKWEGVWVVSCAQERE